MNRLYLFTIFLLIPKMVLGAGLCKEQKQCHEVCERYEKRSIESCKQLCHRFECRTRKGVVTNPTSDDEWTIGNGSSSTNSDSWTINKNIGNGYKNPQHCVITRSKMCQERCGEEKGMKAKLCRRECLQRMCAKGDNLDIAEEAKNPGTLGCRICKQEYERTCMNQCINAMSLGAATIDNLSVPGNLNYGCKKICLLSYCSQECPLSLGTLIE